MSVLRVTVESRGEGMAGVEVAGFKSCSHYRSGVVRPELGAFSASALGAPIRTSACSCLQTSHSNDSL